MLSTNRSFMFRRVLKILTDIKALLWPIIVLPSFYIRKAAPQQFGASSIAFGLHFLCFYSVQIDSFISRVARYTPSLTVNLPSNKIQKSEKANF